MVKEYNEWHTLKTALNNKRSRLPYFDEREIWWCSIGLNVGVEMDGKRNTYIRPVLIFKKQGKDSFYGIPATSQPKKDRPYYYRYRIKDKNSILALGQMRLFDACRLVHKIGTMPQEPFKSLKKQLLCYLDKKM